MYLSLHVYMYVSGYQRVTRADAERTVYFTTSGQTIEGRTTNVLHKPRRCLCVRWFVTIIIFQVLLCGQKLQTSPSIEEKIASFALNLTQNS